MKQIIKEIFILAMFSLVMLLATVLAQRAIATTPQEACEIKGGIWTKTYCAPPDMRDEDISYAQRYTVLKQIEMREVKNGNVQVEN
ncbi:hypothetical protein [Actinobacillus porcinus]|uniref:hypothetical protein n=1 Tax=Actinobacillus porcinus TaxID=51048 RepID=UPI0023F1CBB0|nr:hypothetical protein [Actinobacillus porcinus]MDD7545612.1 hypothetical protein [Actinobacillus porcinus]MDY5847595.1 hypothetical protein [Actinobacillus porcinus]